MSQSPLNIVALRQECLEAMAQAICIPNSYLAPEFRNNRKVSGKMGEDDSVQREQSQSIATILRKVEQAELIAALKDAPSEAELLKQTRLSRIESYAEQFDASESFEYNVDEDLLYRRQLEFANAIGMEFDEEDSWGE